MWRNVNPLDVKLANLPRTMENVSGSYSKEPPLKGTEENHFVMSITRYLMIFTRYLDTFKESSGHFWISQVDEGILQELQRAAEMQTAEMQVPWDSLDLLGYLQNSGHLTMVPMVNAVDFPQSDLLVRWLWMTLVAVRELHQLWISVRFCPVATGRETGFSGSRTGTGLRRASSGLLGLLGSWGEMLGLGWVWWWWWWWWWLCIYIYIQLYTYSIPMLNVDPDFYCCNGDANCSWCFGMFRQPGAAIPGMDIHPIPHH